MYDIYFLQYILNIYLSILVSYQMKSGFIELLAKRVLGNRPRRLTQKPNRYQPIDSYKRYMTQTLPTMQQSIQVNILKKTLPKIHNKQIRKELINSYLRRLFRIRLYEKQDIKNYKNLVDDDPEPIPNLIDPTVMKGINQHSDYDVGFYCQFPEKDMEKAFKHGCFGRYSDDQYCGTRKFGIQMRQQSISIAGIMKLIMKKLQNKQKVEWQKFKGMPAEQISSIINNEQKYPIFFMQLAHQIYKYAQKYRNHAEYNRVWGQSVVTDIITNSILQNQVELENSIQTAHRVVDQVMKMDPLPSANDFSYRCKTLPGSTQQKPIKTFIQLPEKASFYCRTPSFKSLFLGGEGGTGRSMILAYLSMFAFKNNWIIINVPDSYKWTHDRHIKYPRAYNGLYLINQHAVQWLDQFITANQEILQKRSVKEQLYGKCDITGVREDEAQPVPNIYYAERRTHFNQISQKFNNRLQEQQQQLREQAKKRLTNILKKPKNLYEIGLAGVKNPQYATCAMGEILRQVYEIQDIPILECVDSFSYLYRASCYPSFRYYNDRDLWGRVPPYHIAHCRLFVNLDGHKLPNGLKVVAASNYPMYMHKFAIKKIMFPQNYEHKVRNLTPDQFKNAAQFNILNNWWQADSVNTVSLMYSYTLTQGNWGDFQQLMSSGHYY